MRKCRLQPLLLLLAAGLVAAAPSPAADLGDFMQRYAALKPNDAAGRVDLARWCHGKELLGKMADLCTEALAIDPENQAAYAMLREYDTGHMMAEEPERAEAVHKELQDRFGRDFKIKNTRHFTLLYDTSDAFAAARGAQLEQAYDMFFLYFDMQRLRPGFLQHRLISIVFKSYDDYAVYAKAVDGNEVPWAAGYYSGRTNRSAFYDDTTGPDGARLDKTLADMRGQVADLTKQISDAQRKNAIAVANDLIRQRNDVNAKLQNLSAHTGAVMDQFNGVKTLHEATHQLAFNTGIQTRAVDYPLWLTEGLATGFEAQSKEGARGPGAVNAFRIDSLRQALKDNKLVGLKTFLTATPDLKDGAAASLFYAQSWSLFHFLYRSDRAGLEKYLSSLLAQKPGVRLGPQEQSRLFCDAFGGDLDAIEERWRKYLQSL